MAIRNSPEFSWWYYVKMEYDALMVSPTLYLVSAKEGQVKFTEDKNKATKFTKKGSNKPKQFLNGMGFRFMGLEKVRKNYWD